MIFDTQTMQDIFPILQAKLQTQDSASFTVLNPDTFELYAGSTVVLEHKTYIYRGYKAWTDLAELLICKMLTPQIVDKHLVTLTFTKLKSNTFHLDEKDTEKYGIHSHFSHIQKMEEPAFLYYYLQALNNASMSKRKRILNLGINRGDELGAIKSLLDTNKYEEKQFVGIDHSKTAIAFARHKYPEDNIAFYVEDINNLDKLKLGCFDLLISIGTFQSPSINFKPFFMNLVQNYLEKDSAIILGFPNSRWRGGEMIYGAKAPNYAMSEQSLLYSDVIFAKKYLQQKKYRVTITGKQYVFLTATKIIG